MKNDEPNKLKPIYIQQADFFSDNEISLVDLVMVLIHRKKLIALILAVFMILGITYALTISKTYLYSTTLETGKNIVSGTSYSLENESTLTGKLNYSYIPQILSEHRSSNTTDKIKYEIKILSPGTDIYALEINGTEEQADLMKSFLQKTTDIIVFSHNIIYTSIKDDLNARRELARNELNLLKKTNNNETAIIMQQSTIDLLSTQLTNLSKTQVITPPSKSFASKDSRILIVVISTFAGLFIAVFAAFFAEFGLKIKERIEAENKD